VKIGGTAALMLAMAIGTAWGQGQPTPAAPAGTVVLDTYGVWRMQCTLMPPVLATGETAKMPTQWLSYQTAEPAQGWTAAEFDDRFWNRGPAGLAPKTALLARVCLRGRFTVTDPAAVKDLRLWAVYRGGIIVYLNGREVNREHIGKGETLAEGPGGEERTMTSFALPVGALRKGLNVVAVEGVRAAYSPTEAKSGEASYKLSTCEIKRVRLTSSDAGGLVPNAERPRGLQVWNSDVLAADYNLDFGSQAEPLYPVTIIGARNGAFSGKVVLGSTEPIRALKVTPGDLQGTAGNIPASNIRVRYALPWGAQLQTDLIRLGIRDQEPAYPNADLTLLSELADEAPAELPVLSARDYRPAAEKSGPAILPGAVVPVWLTVKVPPDVGPGTYTGIVTVEAAGETAVQVPVELRVTDYALPETQDYRAFVDMVQSPDTLAVEYGVPLWSERHFQMIAESFRLIGETGSRTVYIPLVAHTSLGNEESMVRWVKKADGTYGYDLSIMEKYLDAAEKNMGRPKQVVLVAWEVYMLPGSDDPRLKGLGRLTYVQDKLAGDYCGKGPMVTMVDPGTQKAENTFLPLLSDRDASLPPWKALFDELRASLARRELDKAMMLGMASDMWPTAEDVTLLQDAAGDLPWVIRSHDGVRAEGPFQKNAGRLLHGKVRFGYQAIIYGLKNPDWPSLQGWQRQDLITYFERAHLDDFAPTRWRHLVEPLITGDQRGIGQIGGDYWPAVKDKRGRRAARVQERYPESFIQKLGINCSALAPGPHGPVATQHFEAFREGVQECEARIAIEEALTDDALRAGLGQALAQRCEEFLTARSMMMWLSFSGLQLYARPGDNMWLALRGGGWGTVSGHNWFVGSGWQERTGQLFSLAGEVTRRISGT